jgi:hypothetical protein
VTHDCAVISLVRIVSVLLWCGFYFLIQRPLSSSPAASRHFASLGQQGAARCGNLCAPGLLLAKPGFGGLNKIVEYRLKNYLALLASSMPPLGFQRVTHRINIPHEHASFMNFALHNKQNRRQGNAH